MIVVFAFGIIVVAIFLDPFGDSYFVRSSGEDIRRTVQDHLQHLFTKHFLCNLLSISFDRVIRSLLLTLRL